jgi:hypothetical protein
MGKIASTFVLTCLFACVSTPKRPPAPPTQSPPKETSNADDPSRCSYAVCGSNGNLLTGLRVHDPTHDLATPIRVESVTLPHAP